MRAKSILLPYIKLISSDCHSLTSSSLQYFPQETEVVETKVTKGPSITVDKAAMGQAPFWVAVIGGMTVLKMVRQKAAGRSVLDNKDNKFIPQNEKVCFASSSKICWLSLRLQPCATTTLTCRIPKRPRHQRHIAPARRLWRPHVSLKSEEYFFCLAGGEGAQGICVRRMWL